MAPISSKKSKRKKSVRFSDYTEVRRYLLTTEERWMKSKYGQALARQIAKAAEQIKKQLKTGQKAPRESRKWTPESPVPDSDDEQIQLSWTHNRSWKPPKFAKPASRDCQMITIPNNHISWFSAQRRARSLDPWAGFGGPLSFGASLKQNVQPIKVHHKKINQEKDQARKQRNKVLVRVGNNFCPV